MGGSEERTADVGCGPQVFPVATGQRFSDRISLVGHGLIVVANFSLRSGGGRRNSAAVGFSFLESVEVCHLMIR